MEISSSLVPSAEDVFAHAGIRSEEDIRFKPNSQRFEIKLMTVSRKHTQCGSKSLLKSALNLKAKTFAMNASEDAVGCSRVYLCIKSRCRPPNSSVT